MTQEVKKIDLKHLILWSENPRDPIAIGDNNYNEEIIRRALSDKSGRWEIRKLAKSMGEEYDFSELPTVVFHGKKPIVYDGNRRVIIGKLRNGLVKTSYKLGFDLPEVPQKIFCNVCTEETALRNIFRKHGDTGSWSPLDRAYFIYKHFDKTKSVLLSIEDSTKLISTFPDLNQRFVRDEIFTIENLNIMGFYIINNFLHSRHSINETIVIFSDIYQKVKNSTISTRQNRGKIYSVLDEFTKNLIIKNESNILKSLIFDIADTSQFPSIYFESETSKQEFISSEVNSNIKILNESQQQLDSEEDISKKEIISDNPNNSKQSDISIEGQDLSLSRTETTKESNETEQINTNEHILKDKQTRRTNGKKQEFFGGKLSLKHGDINDLYRDIDDFYSHYLENTEKYSHLFPSLIRMSLRLLTEGAAKDNNKKINVYLENNFAKAKAELTQDETTFLSNFNVTQASITQLLQTGAHSYLSSQSLDQTLAISIILGKILTITCGKRLRP